MQRSLLPSFLTIENHSLWFITWASGQDCFFFFLLCGNSSSAHHSHGEPHFYGAPKSRVHYASTSCDRSRSLWHHGDSRNSDQDLPDGTVPAPSSYMLKTMISTVHIEILLETLPFSNKSKTLPLKKSKEHFQIKHLLVFGRR